MRIRIILLRSQHHEIAQQIRVIKSWQGLVGTLSLSIILQKQLANGSSIPRCGANPQFSLSDDLAGAIAVQLGAIRKKTATSNYSRAAILFVRHTNALLFRHVREVLLRHQAVRFKGARVNT
jgi:hypothetical protein